MNCPREICDDRNYDNYGNYCSLYVLVIAENSSLSQTVSSLQNIK